jgi:hypothetical protein
MLEVLPEPVHDAYAFVPRQASSGPVDVIL